MSVAIVSTSINEHPRAYEAWAKQGDLIVAGDHNSPRALEHFVQDVGGYYITPREQEVWSFSEHIGWQTIQRRNAAIMFAYASGYDYVLTVDDDNFPQGDTFVWHHKRHIGSQPKMMFTGEWLDIGKLVIPPVTQRGWPYGVSAEEPRLLERMTTLVPKVAVSQAHIIGVPDCDAITRILYNPVVREVAMSGGVTPGTWTPFNSQATMWDGTWAPLMACLPGEVDRYDDIWAGFIAERIMQCKQRCLYVGEPAVVQRRNHHDPRSDLRREMYGLRRTHSLIRLLNNTPTHANEEHSLVSLYRHIADTIAPVLPKQTQQFMHAWADEWEKIK